MFCPQCGSSNDAAVVTCHFCGFRFPQQRSASSPPLPLNPVPTPLPPRARLAFGTVLGVAAPAPGSIAPEPSPSSPPPPHAAPSVPVLRPSSPPRFSTLLGVTALPPASQGPDLSAALRDALSRSYRAPAEIVSELTARHGLAVLSDRSFIEQELWAEFSRDVRLILCAFDAGVPQRLSARIDSLHEDDLRREAAGLAESRGLAEEAAEFAVASWVAALRGLLSPRQ